MTANDLIESFETLAEAPGGIDRLRELVLQLAVRGKLVPQDPDDEPASVLLERIAEEKARLVREKKIRKPKKLPPIGEDEIPFEVPEGWAWTRINEFAQLVTDGVHKTPNYLETGVPFLSIKDISSGFLDFSSTRFISEEQHKTINLRCNPEVGDILFCRIGTLGRAVVVDTDRPFSLFVSVGLIKLTGHLSPSFVRITLNSPASYQQYSRIKAGGSHTNKLNLGAMRNAIMPLAPLAEQKRIVARVDELMSLLDRLETAHSKRKTTREALRDAALAALRDANSPDEVEIAWARIAEQMHTLFTTPEDLEPLRQAVLQLAVRGRLVPQDPSDEPASVLLEKIAEEKARLVREGKIRKGKKLPPIGENEVPFEVPDGWEWTRFQNLVSIGAGVTKGRKLVGRELIQLPYLRVANVQAGYLDLRIVKEIEIALDELQKYSLKAGDVLLTEGGDWDKLGRSAIWNEEIKPCLHQNHVFRARPFLPREVGPKWLSMFTNSPIGRNYFQSCSKQTTNLASINKTQLRTCPVPVPPASEQCRIIAKVDEFMSLIDQLQAHLTKKHEHHTAFAAAAVHHLDA